MTDEQRSSWEKDPRPFLGSSAASKLEAYKKTLIHLGSHGSRLVNEIFANAASFIKKPATLSTLVSEIDKLDWYSARQEGLGELYEGLLEKNASEKKSGAGQYFTTRPLIESMVTVMKPTLDDVIQDCPAPVASSSPLTTTCASTTTSTRSPRSSSGNTATRPSSAWSTSRTPTASR